MEDWIREMKFARAWTWAPWFGGELAAAVRELGSVDGEQVVVCPVPMHWSRRWRRGYNQAELMAGKLAEQLDIPMAHLLSRRTPTPPQTAVARDKRRANVRGCFSPKSIDLDGWRVLLVDDVKTSGSTLGECIKVLSSMGARDVDVLVAAVADTAGTDFTRV
jgi:ComF family protein